MIRTTRNPMLGSASFWTQDLSILGFKTKTLSEIVSDMFKNGEQGFFYDPSSLTYDTYGVDQTSIGVPVTIGVADAAEYDSVLHTGMVYRADQYNQSIVNFDVNNSLTHEIVIENTGSTTIAVNADLAMGTVLFTVAAGQKVTRNISPVQVIVITSANDVSTAYFKIHSLKEFSGQYTMFQDAAGTVPVTGVGQALGLMLDKSRGLVREFVRNTNFINGWDGWSTSAQVEPTHTMKIINGLLTIRLDSRTPIVILVSPSRFQAGVWVEVEIDCAEYVSGSLKIDAQDTSVVLVSEAGINKSIFKLSSTVLTMYRQSAPVDMKIRSIKISRVLGNHANQTTSAARPILQDAPRRIDFDGIDDKLITTLPAQLTGCTVVRAVPNVGTQILTNQTIPAAYEDNKDHCGLIVINRALTPSETSAIAAEFNKRAGV